MSFRIAVGGIHTECSTSSPVLMQPEDFRVLRGPDLLAHEYFDFLEAEGVEHLPLLQPLRDFQATARGRGLAEGDDQHLAVVINIAGDARANLAFAQAHVQHQQRAHGCSVAGLGFLHGDADEALRLSAKVRVGS
mgnify:CR=1 FL=1